VQYVSTRGEAPELSFSDVLLTGLARDGGLYVPHTWPQLSRETIAHFAGARFAEVTTAVLEPFVGGDIARRDLERIADHAGARFDHPAVTPLIQVGPDLWVLELFHGPTLAFKDIALQILARLMDHVLALRRERATVVVATSGDTGGAAVEAFRGAARLDIIVLFPKGRVSEVQRRMMTTAQEDNVHALAIEGTFDDCQALVKAMFNDLAFRDRLKLAAVNSINWARIAVQTAYYFVAAAALGSPQRPVSFAVPTGNFGNVFAAYAARRMGLPVQRLVIATNENDILRRAFETGVYEVREVVATPSPSMDIQVASNFERYLFEAGGRDAGSLHAKMTALARSGRFELTHALPAFRDDFLAASATAEEAGEAMRRLAAEAGYTVEPHTACALVALAKTTSRGPTPRIVLATAHPAKFPDAMEKITGERPQLPGRLAPLMSRSERFAALPNDAAAVKRFVESRARGLKGAAA
jgi:threonine synthase